MTHHLHTTYKSGTFIVRESNSDSYIEAPTKWQKTQLLKQNSSTLFNRSALLNMLFRAVFIVWEFA